MRKRKIYKYNPNRKYILLFLFFLLFLGIGYSVLSSDLIITGDVRVKSYTTLYKKMEKLATNGVIAREYTGEHHDSFTEEPSKKIYYMYGSNTTNASKVNNANNVIFAEQCWKMFRTTDTGGVKLIYTGPAHSRNSCYLGGTTGFVGYDGSYRPTINSNYWYGTDYIYNYSDKTFKISGDREQAIWSDSTASDLIGKYTCLSSDENATCSTLLLIAQYSNNSQAYVLRISTNSPYVIFGKAPFNIETGGLGPIGYMYNKSYGSSVKTMTFNESLLKSYDFSDSYWYADSYERIPNSAYYKLVNPFQISDPSDYSNIIGKYTIMKEDPDDYDSQLFIIRGIENDIVYCNSAPSFVNHEYTYGTSYTDNGDGTYKIDSPTTIYSDNWFNEYSNIGSGKYICKDAVNNSCSELWYSKETTLNKIIYFKGPYKFGNGVIYENGVYKLSNDIVEFHDFNDNTNLESINNHHYTCWNATGECTSVSFINYFNNDGPRYIILRDGKTIVDVVNEMLYVDDVNKKNSIMKIALDAWYKHFMLDYDDYIEDTIYCNDRTQMNQSENGFNPNGGDISTGILFGRKDDLSCPNDTDKFSINNNKAKLTYKVGLATYSEMYLLGDSSTRGTGVANSGSVFISPLEFSLLGRIQGLQSNGSFGSTYLGDAHSDGVRPVISLKPGVRVISGDGTTSRPYVIDTSTH